MDKDKLNEACDTAFLENYFPSATESPDPRWEMFADGFKQGASWLMQQPLADRLTEEEKEKIRNEYAELLKAQRKARQDRDTFYGNILSAQRGIYESIFGKELFKEK